jgi:hypothetical protein
MPDIAKHVALSQRLPTDDIDWELARRVGLSDAEKAILPYFADIEGQTVFYMLELLNLPPARDPDTLAFTTLWNYEEFFHAHAFKTLLDVCGATPKDVTQVRKGAGFRARIEDWGQKILARPFPRSFVALWMAWGASQELLTLTGYEKIAARTQNPVLKTLCLRIAKQERRHFAWYYNSARERLAESTFTQRFVRAIFERFWTPVGEGVKTPAEVAELMGTLFPGEDLRELADIVDDKFAALPGLSGFNVMHAYVASVKPLLSSSTPVVGVDRDVLMRQIAESNVRLFASLS